MVRAPTQTAAIHLRNNQLLRNNGCQARVSVFPGPVSFLPCSPYDFVAFPFCFCFLFVCVVLSFSFSSFLRVSYPQLNPPMRRDGIMRMNGSELDQHAEYGRTCSGVDATH